MQLLLIIRILTVKPEGGVTKIFQAVLCLITPRIPGEGRHVPVYGWGTAQGGSQLPQGPAFPLLE